MQLYTSIKLNRASDPPLFLLLHGFLGSSADWAPVASYLQAQQGVITIDLPAHGFSPALSAEHSTFESVVELLADTIRAKISRPIAAVGYSLGGRLLMGVAHRYPELFSALTIVSAFPGYQSDAERAVRAAEDAKWSQRLCELCPAEFLLLWYGQQTFASNHWQPDFKAQVLCSRAESLQRQQSLARMLEVTSASGMPSYWNLFHNAQCPIAYVAGERDHRCCQIAAKIKAGISRARTVIIKEAGHLLIVERPTELAALLLSILPLSESAR
jgi:2-succinyl-6-hydroxy-2,4-cyclohexadiene-1-carboxylate synthase